MRSTVYVSLSFRSELISLELTIYAQHRELGKRKTIVIVAEGAHDRDLQPIRADYIKDLLSERLGLDTRVTTLGHTQRGGRPCALDRILVSGVRTDNNDVEPTCCSLRFKVSRRSMSCWRRNPARPPT